MLNSTIFVYVIIEKDHCTFFKPHQLGFRLFSYTRMVKVRVRTDPLSVCFCRCCFVSAALVVAVVPAYG